MKKILMFIMILFVSILTIGGCGMNITNPQVFDHIKEAGGATLRCKLMDIGVWNMDLTGNIYIAHGLTPANILLYYAEIIDDGGANKYTLTHDTGVGGAGNLTNRLSMSDIRLSRVAGQFFDNVGFDDGVMNRGTVFIWYVD